MRYLKYVVFLFAALLLCGNVEAKENVKLYLFYGDGCPHCASEKEFLKILDDKYDNLDVTMYEVWYNEENANLMNETKSVLNKNNQYVPFTVIGEESFTGFNSSFEKAIENAVIACSNNKCRDIVDSVIKGEDIELSVPEVETPDINIPSENDNVKEESKKTNIPFLGEIEVGKATLPIVAIVLGLVDGFNPCAMWILIFLISMLIGSKNRKRMVWLGVLFLTTSALIYALFMTAWLHVMLTMTQINIIKILIGLVAIIGAIWNLYSFYKGIKSKDTGCEVVNNNKRKKIIDKIKKFTSEKSIWLASIGIITLAISVNFVELACSAGWPLVFTEILALNNLSTLGYAFYILLYILFYLFDDLIIFFIAVITLKITGISNKYTKYSHLIGGILMLIIGLLMIFKPEWLMMNF